jgi:hypothetical protein
MFRSGVAELEPVLKSILSATHAGRAAKNCRSPGEEDFCYGDELWARTIYEFAASYHKAVISRDHIVQAWPALPRAGIHLSGRKPRSFRRAVEQNIENLCPDMRTFEAVPAGIMERKKVRSPCGK